MTAGIQWHKNDIESRSNVYYCYWYISTRITWRPTVNISQYWPKSRRAAEVYVHSSFTLAPDGYYQSCSGSEERFCGISLVTDPTVSRADLDMFDKKSLLPLRRIEPLFLGCSARSLYDAICYPLFELW